MSSKPARRSYYLFNIPQAFKEALAPFKYDIIFDEDSDGDSSDSDSDSDPESAATDIAPAASHSTQYNEDFEDPEEWKLANQAHVTGHPYVYYTGADDIPENNVLAIYKGWFDRETVISSPLKALDDLQPQGKSAVILIGGGHFSAAIVSHKAGNHKLNSTNPFANMQILESKSFHRYTTRRKQGGSQSASDNAHGKAKSAGSNIRRQMEQQLRQEIQELLISWAPLLKECQRVFFRASGRSNKGIIFGFPGGPINRDDPRIQSIPFTTKRATLDEVKRVWTQLTRARIMEAPKLEPKKPKVESRASTPQVEAPASPKPKPEPVEEPKEVVLTNQIVQAIKKSQLTALKSIFTDNQLGYDFLLEPVAAYKKTPTALLYAAKQDKHHVVSNLLFWGADPTIKAAGQALGVVATGKKTKDALSIARKDLGEDKWDWESAKVGPAMTKEELLAKETAEKLAIRQEQEEQFKKEEAKAKSDRLERLIARNGSGKSLGGSNPASAGLTEEDKKLIERERRARAAEARLARFG